MDPASGEKAMALFDWTQQAAEMWRGSNNTIRREILDLVCLNRTLGDVSLELVKRKPFDVFAERLNLKNSRDNKTPLELFLAGVRGWEAGLRRRVVEEGRTLTVLAS